MVAYAAGITHCSSSDAEDLVQGAFVRYWEQQTGQNIAISEKCYLYKMVYHDSISFLRKRRTRLAYQRDRQLVAQEGEAPPAEQFDVQEKVKNALGFLPAQCREVFELSRFEQLKYREIADVLDISEKTVESHMSKALKILRRELADFLVMTAFLLFN